MRIVALFFLLAIVVIVECGHTFMGSSVLRPMVYHHSVQYKAKMLKKRVANLTYLMPAVPYVRRSIQGILAFDRTYSGASANVTQGGVGYNAVNLRMKSERGKPIHFDVYIYA